MKPKYSQYGEKTKLWEQSLIVYIADPPEFNFLMRESAMDFSKYNAHCTHVHYMLNPCCYTKIARKTKKKEKWSSAYYRRDRQEQTSALNCFVSLPPSCQGRIARKKSRASGKYRVLLVCLFFFFLNSRFATTHGPCNCKIAGSAKENEREKKIKERARERERMRVWVWMRASATQLQFTAYRYITLGEAKKKQPRKRNFI